MLRRIRDSGFGIQGGGGTAGAGSGYPSAGENPNPESCILNPAGMNVLNVQNLQKSFGTRVIFDGVSFAVDEGEKVGFIGANGSGKTTLFRVVAGEEGREGGTLALRRGARVGYLSQEPEFEAGATIRSAVAGGNPELQAALAEYHQVAERLSDGAAGDARLLDRQGALMARVEALGGWAWESRVETLLSRVGLDGWDRPVEGLSGGERKRAALARVLLQAPDLLLLDEPTNHLDADTTLWLEDYLLDYRGAVMLITHDRYFLDRVVTRMIEVARSELTPYAGGYTEYLEAKAVRTEQMRVEEEKRTKLIEQELEWVKRSPPARTGKQKARIKRLGQTQVRQEEKRLPTQEAAEIRFGNPPRLGRTVLELKDVHKGYGDRTLIDGFSTLLRAGERIGVIGPNGAGKTTLLRVLLGLESPDDGEVVWGKNTRVAYFDQNREDLDPEHSLLQAVSDTDWVMVSGSRVHVRSYLESFLFPSAIHEQKVSSLSGGERNRLLLARLLLEDANLLVLDEPTNDLDLVTLQVLESALADFPGCVLVVTHDRYFLDKLATALFVFEGGGVVHRHEGGYDLYRRLKEAREEESKRTATTAKPAARVERPAAERPRRLTWKEQRELEGMEAAILEAEEERERLSAVLQDPGFYSETPEKVAEVSAAFREATERVERLYERWAELEAV
jgi:ABC transport system ATP-binding/permease protein